MALTPETLPRHELIGLRVRVADATNPSLVDIEGRIVNETMGTLLIETSAERSSASSQTESGDSGSRVKQVPKQGTTFEFALTDEAADLRKKSGSASELSNESDDVVYVTVDGTKLLSRPALRTEQTGDSLWQ